MMIRSLVQFSEDGVRGVAAIAEDGTARRLAGVGGTLALARRAIAERLSCSAELAERFGGRRGGARRSAAAGADRPRGRRPSAGQRDRPDPSRLGRGAGQDAPRGGGQGSADIPMRMFLMGGEGGKPTGAGGRRAAGMVLQGRRPNHRRARRALAMPRFAQDGGEEPEIAGVYLIDADGAPVRLGYVLATSSPTTSPSAATTCGWRTPSCGPPPWAPSYCWASFPMTSAARAGSCGTASGLGEAVPVRGGQHVPFAGQPRAPPLQVRRLPPPRRRTRHFFGTATPSFSDGFRTEEGDVFEIEAKPFTLPVRNPLARLRP